MDAPRDFFLGWDVGAWHCPKSAESQDAVCALRMTADGPEIVGDIFRGNLRAMFVAEGGPDLGAAILRRVGLEAAAASHVTIAIDSPLAWPKAMVALVSGGAIADVPDQFERNPYLYRAQERELSANWRTPLSPVNHMIGSQSTKAIHFLKRAGLSETSVPGVWSSGSMTAFETYPAPVKETVPDISRQSETLLENYLERRKRRGEAWKEDARDAIVCALVALLHRRYPEQLVPPDGDAEPTEGWIWLPKATAKIPER